MDNSPQVAQLKAAQAMASGRGIVQRVVLDGLKDGFGEDLDTEYMMTVHNYIVEALGADNEAAIELLVSKVRELDPGKLDEVNRDIAAQRILIAARRRHLASVAAARPEAAVHRQAVPEVAESKASAAASEMKEAVGRGGARERIPEAMTVHFEASSADRVDGIYHSTAHEKPATSLQSRDAEVSLLQQLDDWLRAKRDTVAAYRSVEIFVRISKGPCTSCRNLINIFRRRNPGIRIVIEYQQAAPQVKEAVGKDRGQAALSYGYEDAATLGRNSHVRVLPGQEVPMPGRVKGFAAATLEGMFGNFKRAGTSVADFIRSLGRGFVSNDADRPALQAWLEQRVAYEEAHALSEGDRAQLGGIARPEGGAAVKAHARVVLRR